MFGNTLKIGEYYIVDKDGILDLKEYNIVKVRTVKYNGKGYYICVPIEPLVYPILTNGYASKFLNIHKKFLTPTTLDEKIVIRCPMNVPRFNNNDIIALENVIHSGKLTKEEERDLLAIYYKMTYAISFDDCIDI